MTKQRFFEVKDKTLFPGTDSVGRLISDDYPDAGQWWHWLRFHNQTALLAADGIEEAFLPF